MNGQVQLTLTGEAGVSYAIESSSDLQNWTSVVTNSDRAIRRVMTVDALDGESFYRASRGLLPLFAFAVAAQQRISLNGNNVAIDSFDSGDPNYSTGGLYDPAKNKDNGNVVTDDTNSLNIGSATIMGHVRTGPGASISSGTIYAPEVDFILGSSGNNSLNFSGACVAKSVTLNGEIQFHFDENLKRIWPFR